MEDRKLIIDIKIEGNRELIVISGTDINKLSVQGSAIFRSTVFDLINSLDITDNDNVKLINGEARNLLNKLLLSHRSEMDITEVHRVKYKGYTATIVQYEGDQIFSGKIDGINDVVLFEGKTINEITSEYRETVDDYLRTCKELGKDPEIPNENK